MTPTLDVYRSSSGRRYRPARSPAAAERLIPAVCVTSAVDGPPNPPCKRAPAAIARSAPGMRARGDSLQVALTLRSAVVGRCRRAGVLCAPWWGGSRFRVATCPTVSRSVTNARRNHASAGELWEPLAASNGHLGAAKRPGDRRKRATQFGGDLGGRGAIVQVPATHPPGVMQLGEPVRRTALAGRDRSCTLRWRAVGTAGCHVLLVRVRHEGRLSDTSAEAPATQHRSTGCGQPALSQVSWPRTAPRGYGVLCTLM